MEQLIAKPREKQYEHTDTVADAGGAYCLVTRAALVRGLGRGSRRACGNRRPTGGPLAAGLLKRCHVRALDERRVELHEAPGLLEPKRLLPAIQALGRGDHRVEH